MYVFIPLCDDNESQTWHVRQFHSGRAHLPRQLSRPWDESDPAQWIANRFARETRVRYTHTYIYIYICYHTMVSNTAATWLIDVLNHENYTIIIVQQLHLINTCRFLTQVIANLTPKQGAFIKNHLSPRLTVTRLSSNFQLLLATIPLLVTLVQTIELPQIDRCSWHVYHIARPAQLNNK